MPLLSICMPTYNRHAAFKQRLAEFVFPVLKDFRSEVEVLVGDNSEEHIAQQNQAALNETVRYFPNGGNIGYHGNVARLCMNARGAYLWLISDNDELFFDKFRSLIDTLRLAASCGVQAVTIDYLVGSGDNETTKPGPGGPFEKPLRLADLPEWRSRRLPFSLLSQAIVRNDREKIQQAIADVGRNDFIQIAICAMAIGRDGLVVASRIPMLRYENERVNQFRMRSLYLSELQVSFFCYTQLGIETSSPEEAEFLTFILNHQRGRYTLVNYEADKNWFVARVRFSRKISMAFRLAYIRLNELLGRVGDRS